MSKTIDVGIDLGTTNSAIASIQDGRPVIIKNSLSNADVTPSAVRMDGQGTTMVGETAYRRSEDDPANVAIEFKRWIRNNNAKKTFRFEKANKELSAIQLSAEILKALRSDAQDRLQREVDAAVVTVPAMFLVPACEATKEAARLAGIEICSLLQEPVAAAIAYGYQAQDFRGRLMVFDLGGGTFDTTLVTSKDGRMVVIGHDGDEFLGGKDFDWALVTYFLQRITKEYGAHGIARGNPGSRRAIAKLKWVAEEAKKELSLKERTVAEIRDIVAESKEIELTIEISRNEFEALIESDVHRAVSICKRLLQSKNLSETAVDKLILVGGPTRIPLVRQAIEGMLGIKPDTHVDPMTVVADGAALFATTQKRITVSAKPAQPQLIQIRVAHPATASEQEIEIALTISQSRPDATLTITRVDGGWSSGALRVPESNKLITDVILRPQRANGFKIEVRDSTGNLLKSEGGEFTITHGLAVAQATLSRSFGVALLGNEYAVVMPRDTPLPAKGMHTLYSRDSLVAGDPRSVLKIYILEGENPRADRNTSIGEVLITGDRCKRSVPAGQPMEITFRQDESRCLSVSIFIPFLNETFDHVLPGGTAVTVLSEQEIIRELAREEERLTEIQAAATQSTSTVAQARGQVSDVRNNIRAAAGDVEHDAGQKALARLLELKILIDRLEKGSEFDLLIASLKNVEEVVPNLVENYATADDRKKCALLLQEAKEAQANKSVSVLRERVDQLWKLYYRVLFAQDQYWAGEFGRLKEIQPTLDSSGRAARLFEEGERALARNDFATLQTIVWDIWSQLPDWQRSKIDSRFSDAGLTRGHVQSK